MADTVTVPQRGFHGGEIDPSLYSRTDIEARQYACATLRNFVPAPTGPASNRAGLQYVAPVKTALKKTRLIPFTFSTSQSYVLEFGDLYVRVYQGGALITEVVTPYVEADLFGLQYVQSGDTLTITHQGRLYAPRELKRTGASTWTIGTFSTARSATVPGQPTFLQTPVTVADATHAVKSWDWVCTTVMNDEESLPSTPRSSICQLAPDRPVAIGVTTVPGASSYNWYRGRYGVYGYVGNSVSPSFVDDGQVPNYSDTPPNARNPFANNEYPSVATYFQQRLVMANQPSFPQRVLTSQTGRLHNFDYSMPQKDDDSVDFTVSSRQYEEIRALVPLQQLVLLTANTEFIIDNGDKPITPSSTNLIPIGFNGSSWMRPLIVGDAILFVQAQQGNVRELVFGGNKGWGGSDVSLVANHLLASSNRTIVDWAVQRVPHPVVWAVRDDGILLSLTYSKDFEVRAWARHDTDGVFESVCVVPEGSEEVVYVVVRRTVNGATVRYIERMATRHVTQAYAGCFLDSSVWYNGVPAQTFGALGHLEGKAVMVLRDGVPEGPYTVTAGSITLSAPGTSVFIGLPYNADVELLDLAFDPTERRDIHANQKLVARVIWECDRTAGLQAGETFSDLSPWVPPLGYQTPASGLANDQFVVPINSSWNRRGRAVLRQSMPLPVTVLAAVREVDVGGV